MDSNVHSKLTVIRPGSPHMGMPKYGNEQERPKTSPLSYHCFQNNFKNLSVQFIKIHLALSDSPLLQKGRELLAHYLLYSLKYL